MMPEMDQSPATRRRFRFGLRTLLAVVTFAAVASWGYWVAWPWWQEYQERMEFESFFTRFHVGMTSFSGAGWNNHWALPFNWSSDGRELDCSLYRWPNCRYVFWYGSTNNGKSKSQEVTLIRFPNPPIGYKPTTVQGQQHLNDLLQKEFRTMSKGSDTFLIC